MLQLFAKGGTLKDMDREKRENQQLIREIRRVHEDRKTVESLYNLTCDSDMIDCYIHQINALDARYRYLLRTVKSSSMQCPAELLCVCEERVCQKLG